MTDKAITEKLSVEIENKILYTKVFIGEFMNAFSFRRGHQK